MKPQTIKITSLNQPVIIGDFMQVFAQRRIHVTNYAFSELSDDEGLFTIEFQSDDHTAENVKKKLRTKIDVFDVTLN
ncbi:MAG: hypothetical protein M9887_11220 [Chitinophagales bacterium]|nr:hypothetical protein [Chitinophagales bacterium]